MTYTLQPTTFGTSAAVAVLLTFLSPPIAPSVATERSGQAQAIAHGSYAGSRIEGWNFDSVASKEPPTAAPAMFSADADNATLDSGRETTAREYAIGEIRGWASLPANWDGEAAAAPNLRSLKEASTFLCLLEHDGPMPDPMLLASGRAGLYWNDGSLYADLEFTGDGWITYYIEQLGKGKHKGAVVFDGNGLPPVFSALLPV